MPVENEVKFLFKDCKKIYDVLKNNNVSFVKQHQLYLNSDNRIRMIEDDISKVYVFTAKFFVDNKMVEIETEVIEDDFLKLKKISQRDIIKERYILPTKKNEWVVDALFKNNELISVVCECEMDEGETQPKNMPQILKDHILCQVPKSHQKNFSIYNMTDPNFSYEIELNKLLLDLGDENV